MPNIANNVPPCSKDKILFALEYINIPQPSSNLPVLQPSPECFPACSAPDLRTAPQFVISYRRPFVLCSLLIEGEPDNPLPSIPKFNLSCVTVGNPPKGIQFNFGLDLKFNQIWNLNKLSIGDLSSTLSLAPSEKLTLEFQNTQRKVLDQTALDSTEEINSNESTTFDKDVFNALRSTSKTSNWNVSGNGEISLGKVATLGIQAGVQESIVQNSQSSVEHITESTNKSTHSLKIMHKIEIRGISEGIIQNRMTRTIKNPYPDRTLSLNVFQLIKHYSVLTKLSEIRPVLIIQVNDLAFDKDFIKSNSDFLREKLLDIILVDELPLALKGASSLPNKTLEEKTKLAKLALHYLYDDDVNIFNVPPIIPGIADPNKPSLSFDANFPLSGLDDANTNLLGPIFTTLNFFYKFYKDMNPIQLDANAVELAITLEEYLGKTWADIIKDGMKESRIKSILDEANFTEIFRRLSGFLAMVSGMLKPYVPSTDEEKKVAQQQKIEQEEAFYALDRLINHLKCNKNYYIQQFLIHLAKKTHNQAIVDFVNQLIDSTYRVSDRLYKLLYLIFDVERSFIDRQQIVIPGAKPLTEDQITQICTILSTPANQRFNFNDIKPTVDALEVPTDGIHLEVAEGGCVLNNVPCQENNVEFSLNDFKLNVTDNCKSGFHAPRIKNASH